MSVTTEFDLTQAGDLTRIQKFRAVIVGVQPVATVESLQPVEFNGKTHGLKATDPSRDLFSLALQGVPLAWARLALGEISATGGDLRGDFVATASNGGSRSGRDIRQIPSVSGSC